MSSIDFLAKANLEDAAIAKELRYIMIFLSAIASHPSIAYDARTLKEKAQIPDWALEPILKLLQLRVASRPWPLLEGLLSYFSSARFTFKDETVLRYARDIRQLMSNDLAFKNPGSSEYYATLEKLRELGPHSFDILYRPAKAEVDDVEEEVEPMKVSDLKECRTDGLLLLKSYFTTGDSDTCDFCNQDIEKAKSEPTSGVDSVIVDLGDFAQFEDKAKKTKVAANSLRKAKGKPPPKSNGTDDDVVMGDAASEESSGDDGQAIQPSTRGRPNKRIVQSGSVEADDEDQAVPAAKRGRKAPVAGPVQRRRGARKMNEEDEEDEQEEDGGGQSSPSSTKIKDGPKINIKDLRARGMLPKKTTAQQSNQPFQDFEPYYPTGLRATKDANGDPIRPDHWPTPPASIIKVSGAYWDSEHGWGIICTKEGAKKVASPPVRPLSAFRFYKRDPTKYVSSCNHCDGIK